MRLSQPASEIIYPRQFDTVCIERLAKPEHLTDEHARAALVLLQRAYTNLFEKPVNGIEEGTFAKLFDYDSDKRVSEQKTTMRTSIDNGSAYYFVDDDDIPEFSLTALAKVSPSKSTKLQRMGIKPPNCYVNDLVVHPDYQNQGFSRMLLHSVTKFGEYDPDQYVALDAFTANRVINDWFQRIGFREVSTGAPISLRLGEVELQQTRYSTEPHATVADVWNTLESNDSILRAAQIRNA